jgi:hypothetical protein
MSFHFSRLNDGGFYIISTQKYYFYITAGKKFLSDVLCTQIDDRCGEAVQCLDQDSNHFSSRNSNLQPRDDRGREPDPDRGKQAGRDPSRSRRFSGSTHRAPQARC